MRAGPVIFTLVASAAFGGENPLSFTVAGPLTQGGAHELLLTTTPRFGRPEPFARFENLVGFSYGFSARLEAQLLIATAIETRGLNDHLATGGLATRWRWQWLDAQQAPIGLGLMGTIAAGPDGLFVEARVGLEKWLGELLLALNLSADFSVRKAVTVGPNSHLEQSAGIAYRLANHFTSGFEVRSRVGFDDGNYFGTGIFAGPVFGFRAKGAWVSVAGLAQVAAVKASALYGNGEALELRDNERVVMRLQVGFEVP